MKNILKQIACIMMVLAIIAAFAPPQLARAIDGAPEEVTTEGAASASSVIINEGSTEESAGNEDAGSADEAVNNNEENNDTLEESGTEEITDDPALEGSGQAGETAVTVDPEIENGTITMDGLQGSAVADTGYDLATVRQIWTDSEETRHEEYLEYTKQNDGTYTFSARQAESDSVLTAYFYDLNKWDGAVDLTWFFSLRTDFPGFPFVLLYGGVLCVVATFLLGFLINGKYAGEYCFLTEVEHIVGICTDLIKTAGITYHATFYTRL